MAVYTRGFISSILARARRFLLDIGLLGATLSNALAIFDATECAESPSFLSAMVEAPQMGNVIAPAPVSGCRWPEVTAEYGASALYSAACYEQIEHIGILAMIMPERELREVERQVLLRDVMEAAHDAAFEQRPEGLNTVRCARCPARIRLGRGLQIHVADRLV